MSVSDIFIAIGFIVFSLAIIYYFGECMSFQTSIIEGLENKDEFAAKTDGGIAGGTLASIQAIEAQTVMIKDKLLLDNYKDDYIKKIIALDDYFDVLMVDMALKIKPDSSPQKEQIKGLVEIKTARDALNDVMKSLDKY